MEMTGGGSPGPPVLPFSGFDPEHPAALPGPPVGVNIEAASIQNQKQAAPVRAALTLPGHDTAAPAGVMILSSWNWSSDPVSWPNTPTTYPDDDYPRDDRPGATTTVIAFLMISIRLVNPIVS